MDTGRTDILSRHPVPRHRLTLDKYIGWARPAFWVKTIGSSCLKGNWWTCRQSGRDTRWQSTR